MQYTGGMLKYQYYCTALELLEGCGCHIRLGLICIYGFHMEKRQTMGRKDNSCKLSTEAVSEQLRIKKKEGEYCVLDTAEETCETLT